MEKIAVKEGGELIPAASKYKMEVTKNSKGYNWTIVVHEDDLVAMQADIILLDKWARENYS